MAREINPGILSYTIRPLGQWNFHFAPCALCVILGAAVTASGDGVDDFLSAQMARNHIPGLAVAVVQDGKVVKLQGYGVANLDQNSPVTVNTGFQLASATKPFTGLLVMKLVEMGKLSLDDSIARYFREVPPAWQRITIRHLATHTSGLSEDIPSSDRATKESMVKALMKLPLAYEPGSKCAYGFADYVVLAAILEKITGRDFVETLQTLILRPLGMTATSFPDAAPAGPASDGSFGSTSRATPYVWENGRQRAFDFVYDRPGYAAGGLFSSASDLAKLFNAIEDGSLLKPASLSEMWSPPRLSDGKRGDFGMGWTVRAFRGETVVGHSGGPALADLLYWPQRRLAVAVLSSQQRLYPYLAEGVAGFYLPETGLTRAIPDSDPTLTQKLKTVLEHGGEGKIDEDLFAPTERVRWAETMKQMGPMVLGVLDPISKLELLEEVKSTETWTRQYRVWFGDFPRTWRFDLTSNGLIQALKPSE